MANHGPAFLADQNSSMASSSTVPVAEQAASMQLIEQYKNGEDFDLGAELENVMDSTPSTMQVKDEVDDDDSLALALQDALRDDSLEQPSGDPYMLVVVDDSATDQHSAATEVARQEEPVLGPPQGEVARLLQVAFLGWDRPVVPQEGDRAFPVLVCIIQSKVVAAFGAMASAMGLSRPQVGGTSTRPRPSRRKFRDAPECLISRCVANGTIIIIIITLYHRLDHHPSPSSSLSTQIIDHSLTSGPSHLLHHVLVTVTTIASAARQPLCVQQVLAAVLYRG